MDDVRITFPVGMAALTFVTAWVFFVVRDMRGYDSAIRCGKVPSEKIWTSEIGLWYVRAHPPEGRLEALRNAIVRRFFDSAFAALFVLPAAAILLTLT